MSVDLMNTNSDYSWEYFGKNDPYFGVCTSEEYHRDNLNENAKENFFQSGEDHINLILSTVQTHLDSGFRPKKVLDFGCGVGRLLIPLASKCESVVGVDVSTSMLEEAKKNCNERNISNVGLINSDDYLSKVSGKFDFIHSFIVFQHIPCNRGEVIFNKLVELLEEGGVGALHFSYFRNRSPVRRLVYWARKSIPFFNWIINIIQRRDIAHPLMQINEYNLGNLFRVLQENNCHNCYVRFSSHGTTNRPNYGVMIFFQKKKMEYL